MRFSPEVDAQIQASIEKMAVDQGWTEDEKAEAELIWRTKACTHEDGQARYWGFNGGGAASDKQKNYVRFLLRQHSGKREAELIRKGLNALRLSGDRIDRQHIAACIEVLKAL
jgi:hypothetical protein